MLNNRQKELVEKAMFLDSSARSLDYKLVDEMEKFLSISFSNDFKDISSSYSYEWLGGFEWLRFGQSDNTSVGPSTIALRENCNLPHRYVCLMEDSSSMILVETSDSPEKPERYIWCSLEDVYSIIDEKTLIYEADVFNNFTDFFSFLIEKEKEDQGIK